MLQPLIFRTMIPLLLPCMLLLALVLQLHGEVSPGGGFQAGLVAASAVMLVGLVFGMQRIAELLPLAWLLRASMAGLWLYGGTGVVSLLCGGDFLEYDLLHPTPLLGQTIGIMVVELGVGITVACSLLSMLWVLAREAPSPTS